MTDSLRPVCCAMLIVACSSLPCSAAMVVLDQSFESGSYNYYPTPVDTPADWAQTFTVGVNGVLDHLEVWTRRNNLPPVPLVVDIRTTVGGVPTESNVGANVLGTINVPAASVPQGIANWVTVDFSSFGIPVAVGDVLAIVFRADAGTTPGYELSGASSGGLAGGSAYVRIGVGDTFDPSASQPNLDIAFREYVLVPEPASGLMLVFGLMGVEGLGIARRRTIRRSRLERASRH